MGLLFFITSANRISELPEDGAEAPKHVGTYVISFLILICIRVYICMYVYAFVGTSK